jgi:hypothetical protein
VLCSLPDQGFRTANRTQADLAPITGWSELADRSEIRVPAPRTAAGSIS